MAFSSALSYLINFILDATLGMLLIWLGVKVVSWIVQHQKYTYLVFGEYGRGQQPCTELACLLSSMNGEKKWQFREKMWEQPAFVTSPLRC